MRVPLSYVARNLWVRRLTTVLTAGGMALVVFVFSAVLMLDAGLKATMISSGSDSNVVIIRKGSDTEVQSGLERDTAAVVETLPQVARGPDGGTLVSREIVVLDSLSKRGGAQRTNVPVRGLSTIGVQLRGQVRLVEGRMFRPGASEVIVGNSVAHDFSGVSVGQTLHFAQRQWLIVGRFDAQRSAFDSEIWGDCEQLQQAFRRTVYSSLIVRLASPSGFEALRDAIDADPRLQLQARRERRYYEDQSRQMSDFIRILGLTLSVIFSLGAMIGAAITMYASVATRTAEIGTLRALGFARRSILIAFLLESMLLALAGGLAGLAAASMLQAVRISTTNFQTFSELAFSFELTPGVAARSIVFALMMGLAGGVLPAAKAARMRIVDALRAS
ncbi:MAG TPA: ABC transporter permease [Burkholderiaceae bacterium]|jgi:putative ABC transport system permease protein|nr:ABC transporter permease [Burkholderiaceae bacterium]